MSFWNVFLPLTHSDEKSVRSSTLNRDSDRLCVTGICLINSVRADPSDPHALKWPTPMVRKRKIKDGEQTTQAGMDCHEAAAG